MTHPQDTNQGPNPSGLCMCGCGQPAPIAKYSVQRRGNVQGKPVRYIFGHKNVKSFESQYVVDLETGCWNWIGRTDKDGYGKKGDHKAYTYSYERKHGPIPPGMEPDHLCRNRRCVNPAHLEPVTKAENLRRGSNAKLTHADIAEIHRLYPTLKQREIAELFGVGAPTISKIIRGHRWAE